jgi:hypothetical protein
MRKIEEAIEMPSIDVLVHTTEVCKGMSSDQQVFGCKG